MKKKILFVLTLGFAVALFAAGCGNAASGDASGNASADATADASGNPIKPTYRALDYVTLGEYKGVEVTATKYEATEEDYQETVEGIQDEMSYYKLDKDTVESGDTVNIDYVGKIDGEEFDNGSAEGYDLEIGSGTFVDGFEDGLIGKKVGNTVDVKVTFPDDYSKNSDVAGKDAVFTVTLNYIVDVDQETDPIVPEYDDALVEEYTDGEYTTTAEYDKVIWNDLKNEAETQTQEELRTAVQDAVLENATIADELPEGLLDYYYAVEKQYETQMVEAYGMEFEDYISQAYGCSTEAEYKTMVQDYFASEVVPLQLVCEAIGETENITATDEVVENYIEYYAKSYYNYDDVDSFLEAFGLESVDDFREAYGSSLDSDAVSVAVWDLVVDNAKVTYISEEEAAAMESADASADASDEDAEVEVEEE